MIFASLKYGVLERKDSFKWAMRRIPLYLAFTASMLALFVVVEAPTSPSLEEFGAGKAIGIVPSCFAGVRAIAYIFFMPYIKRRLIMKDARKRLYHIPLGPLLLIENPQLYWPACVDGDYVPDYYREPYNAYAVAPDDSTKVGQTATKGMDEATLNNTSSMVKGSSDDETQLRKRKSILVPTNAFFIPLHIFLLHILSDCEAKPSLHCYNVLRETVSRTTQLTSEKFTHAPQNMLSAWNICGPTARSLLL